MLNQKFIHYGDSQSIDLNQIESFRIDEDFDIKFILKDGSKKFFNIQVEEEAKKVLSNIKRYVDSQDMNNVVIDG